MAKHKSKVLKPCVVDFFTEVDAELFGMLLRRIVGDKNFFAKKFKKPVRSWRFTFWATKAEQKALDRAWDEVVQAKWTGIEDELNRFADISIPE